MPKNIKEKVEAGPARRPNEAEEAGGAGGSGGELARGLGEPNAEHAKGPRPDFRVVQTEQTQEGETRFTNVGGMWKSVSRNGNEFYTMRIGKLKLLVFPNSAQ